MARAGFFRSPDMLTPAMMPVTAGKKTANTGQKPGEPGSAARKSVGAGSSSGPPNRSETSDSPIAAMITYWARIAARAERSASAATAAVVRSPTSFSFRTGKVLTRLSANPTV